MVPHTVAEMNRNLGYHKLKILVGAYSHDDYTSAQLQAEVSNAVEAARDAETLFPGTVSGISIHFNAQSMRHLDIVEKMLISVRKNSSNAFKVGVRLENCDQAFHQLYNRSEES